MPALPSRMIERSWALRTLTMVGVLALTAPARTMAQSWRDFHLGTWEGVVQLGYEIDRERLRSPDASADTSFMRQRADEQVTVRNQGFYFIDPQLAVGDLGVTFDVVQERSRSDTTRESRHDRLIGYAFDATLFGGLPYNGTLYANRNQSIATQPFGRTELAFENRGVTARLREDSPLRDMGFPFLSATARIEQQHTLENTTSVLGQTFRRDERQDIAALDGHKGFQTADLDMHYEFDDLRDSELATANFQSQTMRVDYSLDFGPSLNRRWDSRMFYYARTGTSPLHQFSVDEDLRIDHRDDLSTAYRYRFTHSQTPAGTNTSHDGELEVRYQPYRNVDTDARLIAMRLELPAGSRETYASQLGAQYRHSLPRNGQLAVRLTGRYQHDDNRLTASTVIVIDEAQIAPQFLGAGAGFLLNQSFVIASSIVVVDTRGGARLPTTLGLDYDILSEGNFTRIVPLVTSAVIQPGDPLAVSYTYELNPSISYRTVSGSASFSIDYRWIAFSYGHEQSNQTLISGIDKGLLGDLRKDAAEVDLRGTWKTLAAQSSAGYVRYDSTRLVYDEQRYTALVSYRPTRALTVGFNADQTLTKFKLPFHRTNALSTQLSVDWFRGSWTTTALIGHRTFSDTLQPREVINEARIKARFTYGKLDFTSSLTASERTRGGFETINWAVEFVAARRF